AYISNDLMRIGHRLAATERHLYKDRLTPVDLVSLDSSEKRRTQLLTKPAAMRRSMEHWASLATFLELTSDVAMQSEKLAKAEAELASARYHSRSQGGDAASQKKIDELTRKSRKLE